MRKSSNNEAEKNKIIYFNNMTDMFKSFGNYLPLINSAITMICLINKPYYCVIFILLLVINYWVNVILKNQIKEERPNKECDT